MKLLKLSIHNIASIEDAEINFDNQPLAKSEVFLITGKTGSGKSTILDAISLALYGNTPRLKNTQMQGSSPNDDNVRINNPVQLMRRGTGESWVKLSFLGNNGLHYEAEWSVARARKQPTGKIQPKNWSLHIVEKNRTLTKDADISTEISNAIGLDFNQFCRTTMLAQGEFTKFLNSKDNEKSSILEKITGVDIYSKIGAKVYEITKSKENAYHQADDRISQVEILSDEKVKELKAQLEELSNQSTDIEKQRNSLDLIKKWLEDLATKTGQVTNAETEFNDIKQKVESDEFKNQESQVSDWNTTAEARTWLNEKNAAEQAQKTLEQDMKQHHSTFTQLKEGQLALDNEINNEESRLHEDNIKISEQDDKKDIYASWQAINEKLNSLISCNNRIEAEKNALQEANNLLNGDLKTAKENAENEHKDKTDALKTSKDALAQREKELEGYHIDELRKQQTELNDKKNNIVTAKLMLDNRNSAKRQVDQKEEALNAIEDAITELKNNLDGFEKDKQASTIAHEASRAMHDKLRESVEQWAKNMRSKLQVGDKCPVCQREIESAIPHEEEIDSIFIQAEKELKDAEKALNDATDKFNKCEAEIKAQGEQKKRAENEFKIAKDSLTAQEKKTLEACNKCGINSVDNNTPQQLDEMAVQVDNDINEINEKLGNAQKIEKAVKQARKTYDTARDELSKAEQKLNKAKDDIKECEGRIKTSERVIGENKQQIEDSSKAISSKLGATQWNNNWETETREFAAELKQAAESYNRLVEDCNKRQNKLEHSKNEFNLVKKALDAIVTVVPQWSDVVPTIASDVKDLLTKANNLRTQVVATQQQITNESKREEELEKLIQEFVEHNPSLSIDRITALNAINKADIAKAQQLIKETREKFIACEAAVDLKKRELETHKKNEPKHDENETVESLTTKINDFKAKISELGQEIGAKKQQLEADRLNKERQSELIAKRDSLKAIFEQWDKLNTLIGDQTGNKFRTVALSYILENLIHSANQYMRTLTDRYRLKVEPGTFVISVEDAYQGYVSRVASTISGGESFLVSLALALALSDIAQQLQVDMLFIDEGFGTLSGEPLQNAINTLRSLHTTTGRQVGIISHIEELKERIPVQIQVNQEGNSSSSTVEVVEL